MGKRTDWTEKPEREPGAASGPVAPPLADPGGRRPGGRGGGQGLRGRALLHLLAIDGARPPSRDRVVVEKLRYRLADPHRGDVIVFDKPAHAGGSADVEHLVQRIIARPGDEIEARDGIVYLNGQVLDEPYLRPGTVTSDIARQRLPDGRYWVMGDDRQISEDSRQFGPIPESAILGRAIFRFWPWSTMGGI